MKKIMNWVLVAILAFSGASMFQACTSAIADNPATDEVGVGAIASIIGRYYAMDRDKHWDRIKLIDRINRLNGSETIVIGAQQYTRKDGKGKANVFANAIKHDFKSPNPNTRWSDIINLK